MKIFHFLKKILILKKSLLFLNEKKMANTKGKKGLEVKYLG